MAIEGRPATHAEIAAARERVAEVLRAFRAGEEKGVLALIGALMAAWREGYARALEDLGVDGD